MQEILDESFDDTAGEFRERSVELAGNGVHVPAGCWEESEGEGDG